MNNEQNNSDVPPQPASSTAPMRKINVQDILKGETSVGIEFEGSVYILRITSNRKLILTK